MKDYMSWNIGISNKRFNFLQMSECFFNNTVSLIVVARNCFGSRMMNTVMTSQDILALQYILL